MTKRLKKILSIICMVTMLFSNLSLDSLFSPSGLTAAADAAYGNPLDHVDDTMSPGEQRKGTIKAGETYNIRLTTGAGSILTLVGTGMDLWVDVVDESSPSDPSRYISDGGELKVKWAASTNSYLLVFGAKENSGSGEFTVTVDAEGEPAAVSEPAAPAKTAETKKPVAMEEPPAAEEKTETKESVPAEPAAPAGENVKEEQTEVSNETAKTEETAPASETPDTENAEPKENNLTEDNNINIEETQNSEDTDNGEDAENAVGEKDEDTTDGETAADEKDEDTAGDETADGKDKEAGDEGAAAEEVAEGGENNAEGKENEEDKDNEKDEDGQEDKETADGDEAGKSDEPVKEEGEAADETTTGEEGDTGSEEETVEEPVIFEIAGDTLIKYNGSDETVTIPDGVDEIGNQAFAGNTVIRTVYVPATVTIINSYAFANCPNLETVLLDENSRLTMIGQGAFRNDTRLDISFVTDSMVLYGDPFEGVIPEEANEEKDEEVKTEEPEEEKPVEADSGLDAGEDEGETSYNNEEEGEEAEKKITYTFNGIGDLVLVSYILQANGIEYTVIDSAVPGDEEAVTVDEDLQLAAASFFDTVTLAVSVDEGANVYEILLANPAPETEPADENGEGNEEPEETEEPAPYTYAFNGIEDSVLLPGVLELNEITYTVIDSVIFSDEEVLTIDDDLYLTPVSFFDEVIMTVSVDEGEAVYDIVLTNPDPDAVDEEEEGLTELIGEFVTVEVLEDEVPAGTIPEFAVHEGDYLNELIQMIPGNAVAGNMKLMKVAKAAPMMKMARAAEDMAEPMDAGAEALPETTEETATDEEPVATAEEPEARTGSVTGYAAFDVSLINGEEEIHEGEFAVSVSLPEAVNMHADLPADADPNKGFDYSYQLYHIVIHEGGSREVVPIQAEIFQEDGYIRGLSFVTDGLSDFVLAYTVDFTYVDEQGVEHTFSFPGRGAYPVADILNTLEIKYEVIEDVTEPELTEIVGETDETALYLTNDEENGYVLHSDVAFDDTYFFTVTADGKEYNITVTDEPQSEYLVKICFWEDEDKSAPYTPDPPLTDGMYSGDYGNSFFDGYYVRAVLKDINSGEEFAWTIVPITWTGDTTTVTLSKFGNSNTYNPAQSGNEYYDPNRFTIQVEIVKNGNQYEGPWSYSNAMACDRAAPTGYAYFQGEEIENGEQVNLRKAGDTTFYARLKFNTTDPSEVNVSGAWVKVTVEHENGQPTYGYVQITDEMVPFVEDGYTYIDVPVTSWETSNGNPTSEIYTGHELNTSVTLQGVQDGLTPIHNSEEVRKCIVEIGDHVNNFIVVSYATKDQQIEVEDPDTENKSIYQEIYLEKETNRFGPLTLENILNGYNIVTLCDPDAEDAGPRPQSDGHGYINGEYVQDTTHAMAGLLIRGQLSKDKQFADSAYLTKPSYIGSFDVTDVTISGNGRKDNDNPPNLVLGSDNSVTGIVVNGISFANYNGLMRNGLTYADGDFIDWDTLSSEIATKSENLAKEDANEVITIERPDQVITLNGGDHVLIKNPQNHHYKIRIENVGDPGDPNTNAIVVSFADSGSVSLPTVETVEGKQPGQWLNDYAISVGSVQSSREDGAGMPIVWNYPNATYVSTVTQRPEVGHIVAPNADVYIDSGDYNGTVVANAVYNKGSEGHYWGYKGGDLFASASTGFQASKFMNRKVNGDYTTPKDNEIFTFVMEELDWETGEWVTVSGGVQQNNGSVINFPKLTFNNLKEQGTHYYRIRELGSNVKNIEPDTNWNIIKTRVYPTWTLQGPAQDQNIKMHYENTYYRVSGDTDLRIAEETENIYKYKEDGKKLDIRPNQTEPDQISVTHKLITADLGNPCGSDIADTSDNSGTSIRFINTYSGKYCVAVTKAWDDENDRDGVRPDEIHVELWKKIYVNDTEQSWFKVENVRPDAPEGERDYLVLNVANNWTAMIKGVDKYDDFGNLITYGWQETAFVFGSGSNAVTINAHLVPDHENDLMYSTFTYYLKPNGDISEMQSSDGSYTEVSYTNTNGILLIDSYTNDDGTMTFLTGMTNKHETVKTEVQATKVWNDDENSYDLRRDITFRLIAEYTVGEAPNEKTYEVRNITKTDGTPASDITIAANATGDDLTVAWENLPKYYDGHKITYKVVEVEVPEGYSSEITTPCSKNDDGVWETEITNTLELGNLKVEKNLFIDGKAITSADTANWNREFYVQITHIVTGTDGNEQTLYLNADGELVSSPETLTIKPSTPLTFEDIPVGEYTVTEVKDADGTAFGEDEGPTIGSMTFLAALSRMTDFAEVTAADPQATETEYVEASLVNAYTAGLYCIAVTKQWLVNGKVRVDDNALELTVRLERSIDGTTWEPAPLNLRTTDTEYDKDKGTIVLNKANNWSAVAVGMDKMDAEGNLYSYRWVEMKNDTVDGAPEGWHEGEQVIVESLVVPEKAAAGEDTVTRIFLTKLTNSKVDVEIPVEKEITGNDYSGNEDFTVTLTENESNPQKIGTNGMAADPAGLSLTLKRNQVKSFILNSITIPGNYTFTVKETAGATSGMTYDTADKTVTFTVEKDDTTGVLSVTNLTVTKNSPVKITNKYSKITYTPHVKKIVEGAGAPEQTYNFTLTDTTAAEDQTKETLGATAASVTGTGTGEFGEITYTDEGTFTYKITEDAQNPAIPGMTYNVGDKTITLTVTVTKAADGTLTLSDSYAGGDGAGDAITNKYETGELVISKTVVSDNPADKGQEFKFTVTLKNADDSDLAEGTYGGVAVSGGTAEITLHGGDSVKLTDLPVGTTYTVIETAVDDFTTTVTGTGTITEADRKAEGTITTTASNAAFTNTRDTGKLTVTKTVDSPLTADEEASYTFTITLDADITKTYDDVAFSHGVGTFTLTGKNGENSKTITGLPAGLHYTITEATPDGMTLTWTGITGEVAEGDIVAGETGVTATATNKRDTSSLEIDKSVFVDGQNKTGDYTRKTFYVKVFGIIDGTTYYVTDSNGTLSKTESDVKIFDIHPGTKLSFSSLPVGEYTVTEVNSDGSEIETKPDTDMGAMTFLVDLSRTEDSATVIKGGKAKASVVNAYTAGKYCIAVTKQWLVNGKTYVDDSLVVKVTLQRKLATEEDSSYAAVTGKTGIELNKNNNWSYDAIGMDQMDANGVRYEYRWVEDVVPAGWEQGEPVIVESTVKDETTLIFLTKLVNTKAVAQPEVTKEVTGNTDAETYNANEEFTFTLAAVGNAPMPAESTDKTVTIKAGDTGVFGSIEYTAPGTYNYTITEAKGNTNGMSYDAGEDGKPVTHNVTVTVTRDNDTGILTAAVKYDNTDSLTVTNTYLITEAQPKVTKKVTGDTDAPSYNNDEEFTFTLEAEDGAPMPTENTTVTIKANETGLFGKIAYTEEGEYKYTITETRGTTNGMTYDADDNGDPIKHTVTVKVELINGKLEVKSITYDEENDSLEVENIYKTGKLKVTKEVTVTDNGVDVTAQSSDITGKIFLAAVKDSNGKFYSLNGENAGTEPHWVEIKNGETRTWEYLPFGEYTVIEQVKNDIADVPGYTRITKYYVVADDESETEGDKAELDEENSEATIKIKNTFDRKLKYIQVKKVWTNGDAPAETLDVSLLANGVPYTAIGDRGIITLEASEDWTSAVFAVPAYIDGAVAIYTWQEDEAALPEGWALVSVNPSETTANIGTEEEPVTVDVSLMTFTNAYTPDSTTVTVQKVWDDGDNVDGKRPEIKAQLYKKADATAEPEKDGAPVSLTAPGWSYTWNGLDADLTYEVREVVGEDEYTDGGIITVSEGENAHNYTVTITGSNGQYLIKNSYTPETVDIPVIKLWDDYNNMDGKRPEKVTVFLYAGDKPVDEYELNKEEGWSHTFEDLPKYERIEKDDGTVESKEIVYTVKEFMSVKLNEYYQEAEDSPAKNEAGVWEITNEYEPKTEVTVTKVWEDENNQDGLRPAISVQLYKGNDKEGEAVALNEGNNWTYTWTELDKYYWTEGENPETKAYEYTVKEVAGSEEYEDGDEIPVGENGGVYTVTIEKAEKEFTFTVTNSYTPEETTIKATKVWEDDENSAGLRQDVVLTLSGKYTVDGIAHTMTITDATKTIPAGAEDEDLTVEWTGLPVNQEGQKVTYEVTEAAVAGYETDISGLTLNENGTPDDKTDDYYEFTVANTLETGKLTVRKTVNGVESADLGEKEYTFTVKSGEQYVNADEDNKYTGLTDGEFTFAITDSGTVTVTGLPLGEYTVTESADGVEIDKYNFIAEGENASVTAGSGKIEKKDEEAVVDLINNYERKTGSLNVTKKVTGLEKAKIYLVSVYSEATVTDGGATEREVKTYYGLNGEPVGETEHWVEITKDQTIEWKNLPVGVEYTVTERVEFADETGYTRVTKYQIGEGEETEKTPTVETDAETPVNVTVKNDYTQITTEVQVKKEWKDSEGNDADASLLPSELKVKLKKNGAEAKDADDKPIEVTLNDGNEWTSEEIELPAYDAEGQKIAYSWSEGELPEGWSLQGNPATSDLKDDEDKVIGTLTTLTNVFRPDEKSLKVLKVWKDGDNVDGYRPTVKVQLYKTVGEEEPVKVGAPVELSASDGWVKVFDGLPEKEDGKIVTYSVKEAIGETELDNGDEIQIVERNTDSVYTVKIVQEGNEVTITNTHTPETIDVPVIKLWDDYNNGDGKRPDSVMVFLYAGDKPVDEYELKESEDWSHTFEDLPKYERVENEGGTTESKEIVYTVKEFMSVKLNEYYQEAEDSPAKNEAGVWEITNEYEPKTEVTVTKIWEDENDKYGKRPDGITVELYNREGEAGTLELVSFKTEADGTAGTSAELKADNNWTVKALDLTKYTADGTALQYFWKETEPSEYVLSGVTVTIEGEEYISANETTTRVAGITNKLVAAQPEVTKEVTGNTDGEAYNANEEFTFTLAAVDGAPMPTEDPEVSIKAGETGIFGEIIYTEAGTYKYTITETAGKTEGMTYDVTPKNVVVTVEHDDETGEWSIDVKYDGNESLTVTNVYSVITAQPEVTKEIDGNAAKAAPEEEFEFTLAAVGEAPMPEDDTEVSIKAGETGIFGEIIYTEAGTYKYTITETAGKTKGMTYDTEAKTVTVKVEADEDGKLTATVAYGDGEALTVTNTYAPETETAVYKTWNDNGNMDGIRPGAITTILYKNNEKTDAEVTLYSEKQETKPADGKVTLTVNGEEGEYPYSYSDWNDETGYTVTVSKLPKYEDSDEIVWSWMEKTAELPEGYTMSGLEYETVDGVATTHITNSYTPGRYCLTVLKVWDDENNKYGKRPDSITVELYSREGTDDSTLKKVAFITEVGGTEKTSAELNESNNWTVMALGVDKSANGTELQYFWKETEPSGYVLSGVTVTIDGEEYISANEASTRVAGVTNKLVAAQPEVTKEVTGNTDGEAYDADEEFTFTLTAVGEAPMPTDDTEVSIKAGETGIFGEIIYTEAGTYKYTITEAEGKTEGMTYDVTPKNVVVTVEHDEETGEWSIDVKYDGNESLTVTNVYSVITAQPEVTKEVTGNTDGEAYDANEEFTFTLEAVDGAPMPTEDPEVSIKAGETGIFGEITYTEAGTYSYTITEAEGDTEGMTYDTEAKTVTVEVKADEYGKLTATVTYGDEEVLTVTNVYSIITAQPEVTKEVTGNTDGEAYDANEEFTFTLEAVDGAPMPTEDPEVSIKAGETGIFGEITYTEAGTYNYTITEAEGSTEGMTYDTEAKTVTVEVKADEYGKLTATVSYGDEETLTVTNVYSIVTAQPEVTKTVGGNTTGAAYNADEEFEFILAAVDGAPMPTEDAKVSIKAGETGIFGKIKYKEAGTYKYTITETIPTNPTPGMTYDVDADNNPVKHNVVVTVTKDANTEQLTVSVKYDDEDSLTVINKYETGGLAVSKQVISAVDADHEKEFSITVTLGDTSINDTFSGVKFTNGVSETIKLKDSDVKVIDGLPKDVEYTVKEILSTDDGKLFTASYTGKTGKIIKDQTMTALVTNTRKAGQLSITKVVDSTSGTDLKAAYKFEVTLTAADGKLMNGTYGGYTFDGGKAVIGLRNGETVILSQIPVGTEYTVEEVFADDDDRFTTTWEYMVNGVKVGELSGKIDEEDQAIDMTATNTRKTGEITITKDVISDVAEDKDSDKTTYTVTIQLNEPVTGTFDNVEFEKGFATIKIAHGESEAVTITGLPYGASYKVVEIVPDNFETPAYEGQTGTVPASVTITNTRKTGGLILKKVVDSSNQADHDATYTFQVTLNAHVNGTYSGITFKDGKSGDIAVTEAESVTIEGLPAGIGYMVTETEPDGFVVVYGGETGAISAGTNETATVTNIKLEGGLVVSKKVISAVEADHSKKFAITVELGDKTIGGKDGKAFGEATFKNGVAELTLADGDIAVITGLPKGITYTVTEQGTDAEGFPYEVSYTGETGTIEEKTTAHAEVTNTRKTGELKLMKTVDSPMEEDKNQLFGFTLKLKTDDGKPMNGKYGGYTFADGTVQIWLKHGDSATISQIPVGTTWEVIEAENDLYDVTYSYKVDGEEATDVSYTIEETEEGKIPTVTVEAVNIRKLGELKIRKTFNGIPDGSDEITKNLKFRVFGPYGLVGDVTYGEFAKDGTYTFTKLPIGEYVVYELNPYGLSGSWMMLMSSVTSGEAEVAAGETATVELKNDYKVPKTSVIIMKKWKDKDDEDGSRPETLKVTLLQNGKAFKDTVLTEQNNWIAELKELPLYDANNNEYKYTWREEKVEGYELVSTETFGNFTELTNEHEPDVTTLTVVKVWQDKNNKDGLRPTSLAVTLYNGTKPVQTVLLNDENNWTATIADLPEIIDGQKADYNWKEQEVLGYRSNVAKEGNTTTFTNTYNVPKKHGKWVVFEEYETPLSGEFLINHVGDCYD